MGSSRSSICRPTGREALEVLSLLQREGRVAEVLVQERLNAVRRRKRDATHTNVLATVQAQPKQVHELEPGEIELLIEQLLINFRGRDRTGYSTLHPNMEWAPVERALRANPQLLFGIKKMEETGGRVDVIWEHDNCFALGDASAESPILRRNVVFDARAITDQENDPRDDGHRWCGRNAEDMVKEWGVRFMHSSYYMVLQRRGSVDRHSESFLETDVHTRARGSATVGYYYLLSGDKMFDSAPVVTDRCAWSNSDRLGFRCMQMIPKAGA
jgi:hypothetical protein